MATRIIIRPINVNALTYIKLTIVNCALLEPTPFFLLVQFIVENSLNTPGAVCAQLLGDLLNGTTITILHQTMYACAVNGQLIH